MSEENKTVELKEDELEKVSGGTGYTLGNPKPQGYAFYPTSSKEYVDKVANVVRHVNDTLGYEYTIDYYFYGEYIGQLSNNLCDFDIDEYVYHNGRPQ